ncbi:MAG: hypothetical protein V2I38_08910 [Alcanivoracaceae bacterium]|nr:hypothetical protein [Alcanivoracaceae bacterium]
MTLASDLQQAITDLYTIAGISATYTDRDSATQSVTAIVEYDLQQFSDIANVAGSTALISVRVSEMANPPRRGETYTVGSEVYTVDSILLSDDLEHRALVA